MPETGAEACAKLLRQKGINRVYCFPGGTISPLLDAIGREGIQVVVARNEAGAGHMAQGAYRVSGKPQVVLVTSGPGVTNAATPVADAYFDSDAVVFLTGQVSTDQMKPPDVHVRQAGFQETDTTAIMDPISKAAFVVGTADELVAGIDDALHIATARRPGPVVVDCPMDAQRGQMQGRHSPGQTSYQMIPNPLEWAVKVDDDMAVKSAIVAAKSPVIVAGRGCLPHAEKLREFAQLWHVMVVHSLPACGAVATGSPIDGGMLGHTGHEKANKLVADADVVIALGTRLDIRQTGTEVDWWSEKTIVRVDFDHDELFYARVKPTFQYHEDVGDWLERMVK